MKKILRYLVSFVALSCMSLFWVSPSFSRTTSESIVAQYNTKALEIYDNLKQLYINKTDPLIIAWGDKLTFYHGQISQDYPIVSEEYNELKSIAHTTLAVFALFNPLNRFPENLADVQTYKGLVVDTEKAVPELPLSSQQKQRQTSILRLTNALLKNAIRKNTISSKEVNDFFSSVSPLIMQNINDATKIEITLLNKQMAKIQHQLTTSELNKLFVIIPVGKMPRQANIVGQYFAKYLRVPIESERLIFAEGLTDTKSVLSLVGTWQIESSLSTSYFHDRDRMKKDILGHDTAEYLKHCKVDMTKKTALICD